MVRSNRQKLSLELEVLTIRPCALDYSIFIVVDGAREVLHHPSNT